MAVEMGAKIVTPHRIGDIFAEVCSVFKPEIVCDVGTRDCEDALRFRACSPSSRVFAFEANPENYFEYCLRPEILQAGVQVQFLAISDSAGSNVVRIPHYASHRAGGNRQQRGTSSLRGKVNESNFIQYTVPQATLDSFFRYVTECEPATRFAFWIDVEGVAFEVLTGMKAIISRTLAINIEVESVPHYQGQRLASDVVEFMASVGMQARFSTDPTPGQFDLLFLHGEAATFMPRI